MARALLKSLDNINFGPDSVTREDLIALMSKLGNREGRPAAMTIHSSELSSLIEPSGIKMIQFLTDIFDTSDDTWKYSTKHQGKATLHFPVLNVFACTTPSWIANDFPADALNHGFTARVVFVYEEDTRFDNPYPRAPDSNLIKSLINDLKHISLIRGPFEWGPGSKETYAKYYGIIKRTIPKDYRVEGFHWRKRIHVLKVAMLLSLADNDSLVLMPRDIEAAWDIITLVEEKMPLAFSAVGKYEHASDLERILYQITATGGMSTKEIYERNYAVGDVNQLANILQMLENMGKIKKERGPDGRFVFTPA